MVEEYLEEVKKKPKYICTKRQGCYWAGDLPVKQKNRKFTCPVCGSEVVKNFLPESINEADIKRKANKYINEARKKFVYICDHCDKKIKVPIEKKISKCPYCGSRDIEKRIDKYVGYGVHEVKQIRGGYLNEAPIATKGWTQKSVSKFEKTIGKKADEHGFFDACVDRMEGTMGEQAKGFCASLKDARYNSPMWRGKEKSKKDIKKDVKSTKFPKSKQLKKR